MARRKRLSPLTGPTEETPGVPPGPMPVLSRPPVAEIAAASASQAALEQLADEVSAARREGRMVLSLPLEAIEAGHLLRDRMHHDTEDMAALKASLAARGQQTPIEVTDLGQGRYGLISGARRLAALSDLAAETGEPRFGQVLCLLRSPEGAAEAYLAMVEENEIRTDLSFYERGRLVAEAVRMGLFADAAAAVKGLFGNAPPARRSKILSFVALHRALGPVLRFPTAIPEKLGLAIVAGLKADPDLAARLAAALKKTPPADAEAERRLIERALRKAPAAAAPRGREVAPGIRLEARKGRLVLSGAGVGPELAEALEAFLAARGPLR
ncbi:hypothetical protein BV509_21310 [Rhodovulum sulfidophilum]|uniref:ParB N-terminal domain-containing protein n=1 Tax=Rhodovulum visakhapatnamense TaxID=364297 RepID=A0ABS1RAW0_9RHOB|nr:ParB N-terminal domain-containing protein [Rhodovulum visakhapatnamense]MBL3568893.1 ParB N-terminal domain-containing protein [Rhodovulum visakhapatnamense]MBL3576772.1 ParB N-terminal domain-containing protein [Rhodovulum visakhapatnamense]OLS42281.1 hypothetical protein BV509_21310 [Rhodovulum sulfidophilum]